MELLNCKTHATKQASHYCCIEKVLVCETCLKSHDGHLIYTMQEVEELKKQGVDLLKATNKKPVNSNTNPASAANITKQSSAQSSNNGSITTASTNKATDKQINNTINQNTNIDLKLNEKKINQNNNNSNINSSAKNTNNLISNTSNTNTNNNNRVSLNSTSFSNAMNTFLNNNNVNNNACEKQENISANKILQINNTQKSSQENNKIDVNLNSNNKILNASTSINNKPPQTNDNFVNKPNNYINTGNDSSLSVNKNCVKTEKPSENKQATIDHKQTEQAKSRINNYNSLKSEAIIEAKTEIRLEKQLELKKENKIENLKSNYNTENNQINNNNSLVRKINNIDASEEKKDLNTEARTLADNNTNNIRNTSAGKETKKEPVSTIVSQSSKVVEEKKMSSIFDRINQLNKQANNNDAASLKNCHSQKMTTISTPSSTITDADKKTSYDKRETENKNKNNIIQQDKIKQDKINLEPEKQIKQEELKSHEELINKEAADTISSLSEKENNQSGFITVNIAYEDTQKNEEFPKPTTTSDVCEAKDTERIGLIEYIPNESSLTKIALSPVDEVMTEKEKEINKNEQSQILTQTYEQKKAESEQINKSSTDELPDYSPQKPSLSHQVDETDTVVKKQKESVINIPESDKVEKIITINNPNISETHKANSKESNFIPPEVKAETEEKLKISNTNTNTNTSNTAEINKNKNHTTANVSSTKFKELINNYSEGKPKDNENNPTNNNNSNAIDDRNAQINMLQSSASASGSSSSIIKLNLEKITNQVLDENKNKAEKLENIENAKATIESSENKIQNTLKALNENKNKKENIEKSDKPTINTGKATIAEKIVNMKSSAKEEAEAQDEAKKNTNVTHTTENPKENFNKMKEMLHKKFGANEKKESLQSSNTSASERKSEASNIRNNSFNYCFLFI